MISIDLEVICILSLNMDINVDTMHKRVKCDLDIKVESDNWRKQ